jgi:hypothetical protein
MDAERRLRRAAVTRWGVVPEPESSREDVRETEEDEEGLAARRLDQQGLWVELQVRRAMERGDFDNLPGAGKPLKLPDTHDPDWWVKRLIEREKLSGVAPPAIGLRREDAELDETLDREATETGVRRIVDDFNRRVVEARRQLQGGPPVVTKTRDPDDEVERWRARRTARVEESRRRRAERDLAEASRSARPRTLRRLVLRRRHR